VELLHEFSTGLFQSTWTRFHIRSERNHRQWPQEQRPNAILSMRFGGLSLGSLFEGLLHRVDCPPSPGFRAPSRLKFC
jgi:hypothetical protein